MLIEEISKSNLSFYIISDVENFTNEIELLKTLRNVDYKTTEIEKNFLDLEDFERPKPHLPISSYIGSFNNTLILKDTGIYSDTYVEKLTSFFPNKLITRVVFITINGNESTSGGIIQSFLKGELVLHLRKIGINNNDIVYDKNETFIPQEKQSDGIEIEKTFLLTLINNVLEKILGTNSLKNFKITKYDQIRFLEFKEFDKIYRAIERHLPIINDNEISSAQIGRELRSMLNDEKKGLLFPNAKEVNEIIANIFSDLIDDSFVYLKSKKTFRKKNDDYVARIVIGGSNRTGFSIIFDKSFKEQNKNISVTKFMKYEMENELTLGESWHNFATQLYYHLKCGFEKYYPLLIQ